MSLMRVPRHSICSTLHHSSASSSVEKPRKSVCRYTTFQISHPALWGCLGSVATSPTWVTSEGFGGVISEINAHGVFLGAFGQPRDILHVIELRDLGKHSLGCKWGVWEGICPFFGLVTGRREKRKKKGEGASAGSETLQWLLRRCSLARIWEFHGKSHLPQQPRPAALPAPQGITILEEFQPGESWDHSPLQPEQYSHRRDQPGPAQRGGDGNLKFHPPGVPALPAPAQLPERRKKQFFYTFFFFFLMHFKIALLLPGSCRTSVSMVSLIQVCFIYLRSGTKCIFINLILKLNHKYQT